ncbi:hypothetical protein Sdia_25830 [Streptomyces diastaticus subsp. diastaticus]|uniref:Uncharacterized protein n=1 Tax=Streptomyces diastaticus subsp. diastaticus TaxID=68040 RepID=A0ABQ1CN90_STRDI|nr:hypothetical protein Sdia_25830 [Streptomyces diastaticus subsp. diastaticus]GGU41500.1 hypothetical protein GCM10015534_50380 [Streptomyces diastaticus subsp. diastaticus]
MPGEGRPPGRERPPKRGPPPPGLADRSRGPLPVTGVHWLDDFPEGRLPAIPGRWEPAGAGAR